jgi:hypothetical protein
MIPPKENYEDMVWTDNEQARYLIWESYMGFIEHYNTFMMYKSFHRVNPLVKAGLVRYSVYLYEEIRFIANHFSVALAKKNHDLKFYDSIIEKQTFFEDNNLILLRRFFGDVLYISGLKNIIFKRDKRDGIQKARGKYNLAGA